EFILATDLRNREIVLGKLSARLANLGLLLMAGLPVLSFLQFLGGVDPGMVIAGFCATALTLLSLASLSMFHSVLCKRAFDAIVLSYLSAVAYVGLTLIGWSLLKAFPTAAAFPSTETWSSPVTIGMINDWLCSGNPITGLIELIMQVEAGTPLNDRLLLP